MSPEAAEVREWLSKVDIDLAAARKMLGEPDPIPEAAAFHCQQAVEKALKAYLTWRESPFGKTHNLKDLGDASAAFDSTLQGIVGRFAPLTQFAWRYRYPGAPVVLPDDEASDILAIAEDSVAAILSRLPEDFKPTKG